jgi:tRNA 5-methylaminomethyl-2-thiouridine biosynthesis bifunctional protein
MRGQMTHVAAVHDEAKIYCQQGHFLPLREGIHAVGASFNPHDLSLDEKSEDHVNNLQPWQTFFGANTALEVKSAWVGVRGVSLDHLPIVGFVPDEPRFLKQYQRWQHHANLSMDSLMPNIPGLYVFAGFGARGLLTIPYLASYMTALMSQQPFLMSAKLTQALSPARFLKSTISKSEGCFLDRT